MTIPTNLHIIFSVQAIDESRETVQKAISCCP